MIAREAVTAVEKMSICRPFITIYTDFSGLFYILNEKQAEPYIIFMYKTEL